MIIFKHPADIRLYLSSKTLEGITTGFVPTMGALHPGHIALVTKARNETQMVISSIFVNPSQFNNPKDFEKYPCTIERDVFLLEKAGCDILFLPSVADIYPDGIKASRNYELGYLETILEGKFRHGHFQGVCQVVHRLLDIVAPGQLYLGKKDYQQCLVIKKLVELLEINTLINICLTQREADGLAMSSRNLRLTEAERKKAPYLYEALVSMKKNIKAGELKHIKQHTKQLLTEVGFNVDYVEIAIAGTLEIIQYWDGKTPVAVLAAAYLNEVRLIDNITMNETE